jgi:transposase InsO family protein
MCGLMPIAVSSYRYRSRRSDESLREQLVRLAREKPRYGYRRLQVPVEREGERVNHKRLWRVYREADVCLKRKKRRHCVRVGSPRPVLSSANQEWALDFAHDVLAAGRNIRVLSVVEGRSVPNQNFSTRLIASELHLESLAACRTQRALRSCSPIAAFIWLSTATRTSVRHAG